MPTVRENAIKPIPRLWTTYHLWDKWCIDTNSDGEDTLAVDEPDQVMLYTGIKRYWRNKGSVTVLFKHDDGTEQVILLDPSLEIEGSMQMPEEIAA